MLARVVELALGAGIAVAVAAFTVQRSCARFRRRHPSVGQVWRSSPRAARRRVRRAIRRGRAIEHADAAAAIDGIDATLKLRRARLIGKRQPLLRNLLSYCALFLVALGVAVVADGGLSAFATIYVGWFGLFVLLTALSLVQHRNWDERWRPRLAAARQSATDALRR